MLKESFGGSGKKSSREMFKFLGATRSFYGRDIYLRLQIMTLLRSLYS